MSTNIPINTNPPLKPYDGKVIARRILDNDELVMRILESAEVLSPPMRVDEFMAWLRAS